MLLRLEIKDLAVIENAVFEPHKGFNAITGETGAGKSLLIDAISLVMGKKASKGIIRSGSESCYVEALFDVSDVKDKSFYDLLSESGIETEDDLLIISRKISSDGKSIARINGRTVILAILKAVSSYLIDIHGQHDTQMIFDDSSHSVLLDSFGGEEISNAHKEYSEKLKSMKSLVLEIRKLSISPEEISKRKDYLMRAVSEINKAGFTEGEEEELIELNKKYRLLEKNSSLIFEADSYINGDDSDGLNISSRLSNAEKIIAKLSSEESDSENTWKALYSKILDLISLSEEVSASLSGIAANDIFDKNKQDAIVSRLGLLLDLKSKYSCNDISELLDFAYKSEDELQKLEDNSKSLSELKKKRSVLEEELLKSAKNLSLIRKKYAEVLSNEIKQSLYDLEMTNARFEVNFTPRAKERFFSDNGIDDISFVFSANPGEELKSLSQTASGGEASRIMLAIKTILSDADTIPTLIFDEIDTGVSGAASTAIASKLLQISKNHQVLCVTHTAQLAASSDNNYLIRKITFEDRTNTTITELDEKGRIDEVSRLLSGSNATLSVDLAKELISFFRR